MLRANINLRIKGFYEFRLSEKAFRKRRKGEILHLALSFLETTEDLSNLNLYLKKALFLLGEKVEKWDIKTELLKPLEHLFSLPEVRLFFSPKAKKIFTERSILIPSSKGIFKEKVLRPDRIVVFKNHVLVVDFKSEIPKSFMVHREYRNQVRLYSQVIKDIFALPTQGYLLYLLKPLVEKVY